MSNKSRTRTEQKQNKGMRRKTASQYYKSSMKKKDPIQELLDKHLPKDYAETVASECDVTADYVRMVKRNDRQNENILECLIVLAKKNKRKSESRNKRLAKLARK